MVYITLDELKEILPDILDSWIDDDDGNWEWIFQEIEQKCHVGAKHKGKKWKKGIEDYVSILKSDVCDLNDFHLKLNKRVDDLSNKYTELSELMVSNGYFTEAQVAQHIYNRMANRGATREELDSFREVVKKYDATSYSWNKEKKEIPIVEKDINCLTCKYRDQYPIHQYCPGCGDNFSKWEAKSDD